MGVLSCSNHFFAQLLLTIPTLTSVFSDWFCGGLRDSDLSARTVLMLAAALTGGFFEAFLLFCQTSSTAIKRAITTNASTGTTEYKIMEDESDSSKNFKL